MEAVSYRDDDAARAGRAETLIREIAELERQKVAQLAADQRLVDARRELVTLQAPLATTPPAAAAPERAPSFGIHALVFSAAAAVAFLGYTLFT
ncbi:MAG TPA: hypothetical protein VHE35_37315 [Kofleriaceae bacterium]|nr:hypothetical protein [Kofleriaceae bacterium]